MMHSAFIRNAFLFLCVAAWWVTSAHAVCTPSTVAVAMNSTELPAHCGIGAASGLTALTTLSNCNQVRTPERASCVCRLGFSPGLLFPCQQNTTVTRYCNTTEYNAFCEPAHCVRVATGSYFDDLGRRQYNFTAYLNETCFRSVAHFTTATQAQMIETCGEHYINPTALTGTCYSYTNGGGYSNCTFNSALCMCSASAPSYFQRAGYPPCTFDYGVYPCQSTEFTTFCGEESLNCTKRCLKTPNSNVTLTARVGLIYNTTIVDRLTARCHAKFSTSWHFAPNHGEQCINDGTSNVIGACPCVVADQSPGTFNPTCGCYTGVPGSPGNYRAANQYCGQSTYGEPCPNCETLVAPACEDADPPSTLPGGDPGNGYFDVATCVCVAPTAMTEAGVLAIKELCPLGQALDLSTGVCQSVLGACTVADNCTCAAGFQSSGNWQYCQYTYEADNCLVSDGEARDTTNGGVFVASSRFICPVNGTGFTLEGSEMCTPIYRCKPATGRTPVPLGLVSQPCDGADRDCNEDDIHAFCGVGFKSCLKRCQYGVTSDPSSMGLCVFISNTCQFAVSPEYIPCNAAQLLSCGVATSSCTQAYIGNVAIGLPTCVCTSTGFKNSTAPCDQWAQYVDKTTPYCEEACGKGQVSCAQRRFLLHTAPTSMNHASVILRQYGLLLYDTTRLKWSDNMTAVRSYAAQKVLQNPFYVTICSCDASPIYGSVGSASPSFNPSISLPNGITPEWTPVNQLYANPQFDWTSTDGYQSGVMIDTTWGTGITDRWYYDFYSGYPVYPTEFLPSIIDKFYHVRSCLGPSVQATPSYPQTLVEAVDNYDPGYYYSIDATPRDMWVGGWCSQRGAPRVVGADLKNYAVSKLEGEKDTFTTQLETLIAVYYGSDASQCNDRYQCCNSYDCCDPDTEDCVNHPMVQWVAGGNPCRSSCFGSAACTMCNRFPEFAAFYQLTIADDVFERRDVMITLSPTQLITVNSWITVWDNIKALENEIIAAFSGNDRVGAYYAAFHSSLTQVTIGNGLEFADQTLAVTAYPGPPGQNIINYNSSTIGGAARIVVDTDDFSPYYKIVVYNRVHSGCDCIWKGSNSACYCNKCCDFGKGGQPNGGSPCTTSTTSCSKSINFGLQIRNFHFNGAGSCPSPMLSNADCSDDTITDFYNNCDYYATDANCACTPALYDYVTGLYCHHGKYSAIGDSGGTPTVNGVCVCDAGWYVDPATGRCTYEKCGDVGPFVNRVNPAGITIRTGLQYGTECNGHGRHDTNGNCVCDDGWIAPCCLFACADVANANYSCDPDAAHTRYCDSNNTAIPRWVCAQTPEGFWDQPCCQNFIWYSTESTACSYQTSVTYPNGTVASITPLPHGVPAFGEIVTNSNGSIIIQHTFSRPYCACVEPWTGPMCNISTCPSTVGGGVCNGKGTCILGSCQQMDANTNSRTCLVNGIPTGYSGCSCEEDISDECFDVSSGQYCAGPTRGTCVLLPTNELQYGCECINGFSGRYCTTPPCDPTYCNSPVGGVCMFEETPQRCDCYDSKTGVGQAIFEGARCNISVTNQCGAVPGGGILSKCNDHGECVFSDALNDYHCICADGYTDGVDGPCTLAPCSPACVHGICDTGQVPPACRCYKHWQTQNSGSPCSVNDCAPLGLPLPLEAQNSICECLDNTTTFESSCALKKCVFNTTNGVTCGPVHPLFVGNHCPTTTVCPSSACNCCNNGTCTCHWSSQFNNQTGLCNPICDETHTTDIQSTEICNGQICFPVFSTCVCAAGYNPATNCQRTFCQNGGVLSADHTTCNCLPQFTGQVCEHSICNTQGLWNFTSGRCACFFPYTGDDCHTHKCLNGGAPIPDGPNAPNSQCSCPQAYAGILCQVDRCAIGGGGFANATGHSCTCTGTLSGPLCNICASPNQNVSNVCICDTQFIGQQCQFRRCGIQGTYNATTGNCTCGGVATKDPTTGNCTLNACGPFGTANADLSACSCVNGSVLVPLLDSNHSVWCMPVCLNNGTYNNALRACTCPSGTVQPFCARASSSSSSSSSTGAAGPHGSSSSSSTGAAPHRSSSSSSSTAAAHASSSSSTGPAVNASSSTGAAAVAPSSNRSNVRGWAFYVLVSVSSAAGIAVASLAIYYCVNRNPASEGAGAFDVDTSAVIGAYNPVSVLPVPLSGVGGGIHRTHPTRKRSPGPSPRREGRIEVFE